MIKNTRFAENKKGKIVEAKKRMNTEDSFICLGCREIVRAYAIHTTGERSQSAHFRHIGNTGGRGGIGCGSYESYIHNFSKRKFAENYEYTSSLELKRKLEIVCNKAKYSECSFPLDDVINLKEKYPYIKVEARDGSFIPDCLIYNNNGEKIYIEIKYKSPVSQEKKDSGIPIIEIEVETEEEILEIINDGFIDDKNHKIHLINFEKVLPNTIYDCGKVCPQDILRIRNKRLEEEEKQRRQEFKEKEEKRKKQMEKRRIWEEECKKQRKEKPLKKDVPTIQNKPKVIGEKTVQLFIPKKCFKCETHPIHYMNVGRIVVDSEYNIVSIEEELFKDEIIETENFSIAKRKVHGDTNAYYCPICSNRIAKNRIQKGFTSVSEEEKVLEC